VTGKSSEMTFVSHIASLRSDILAFEQIVKETIGSAWDRFSHLLASSPDWPIPDSFAHLLHGGFKHGLC
jgi:hypothetical protein